MITLHTNFGDITIVLDVENAPKSAANFRQYAEDGFYAGTIFHRVINDFMIQGGGFDHDMQEKETRAPITNEADNGLKNDCYTLAMARTMDPDSASSQFFINIKDNDFLNHSGKNTQGWGYCVFAKVTKGQEVVDKIKAVETGSNGFHQDVPTEPVIIEKVSISDAVSSNENAEESTVDDESNADKASAS
ncbi:MAG: peptidyl-prolyl cis-trans isomerase B (cyclophilin B) [Candidatus Endobugula sp.]|jgi:peptidyl-prolyl cis-trans isomerase B (cyclophilin B)